LSTGREPAAPSAHFDFDDVFDADEYLYFYEETLRAEDTRAQVGLLERALGLSRGAKILDLGCGHGRHANELARRGYDVTGVDLVPGFLDAARAEAQRDGLDVTFVHGDVRGVRAAAPFDHAICLFDAFGFLDDAGNEDFLASARAALRPGGSLVLDVRNRDWIVRSIQPLTILDKGDDMMIDRHSFDSASGRLVDRRTYVRGGRARTVTFSIRLYSLTELGLLLRSAGFEVERAWGGWDESPIALHRNRMLIVARDARGGRPSG
jgi:SAM-dependent methyltransferase